MAARLIMPLLTEEAYAAGRGLERRTLYPAERIEAGPPWVLPDSERAFHGQAPLAYDFPGVTATVLRDTVVRGRSNVLTAPDAVIRHGLADLALDILPEVYYERLAVSDDQAAASWAPGDPFAVGYLPEGAAFTDGSAGNYAHWMTEVLPRIAAFLADGAHAGVPLIVDSDLHPNLMRSIALVVGGEVPIVTLAPDQALRVGVLHNVSPTGYVPFKLRPQPREMIRDGVFGGRPLRDSVERLRRAVGAQAGGGRPRLLLLRRNAMVRQLANEAEIAEALTPLGFDPIEPERLSLEEQITLYSRAGMVVGTTGAAIANLIFCQPDCPVVVIMKHRNPGYWYWRRMAAAAGSGPIVHVSGAPDNADAFDPDAGDRNFRVELKNVLDGVDLAGTLSER